ncbi:MAG: chorismate mutase [Candidatus Methanomethylophilaceae archaeon]|jgi:chorismate mutase
MTDIEKLRKLIADIDYEILYLVAERLRTAEEIGRYKFFNDLEVEDPETETLVKERYRRLALDFGIDPDKSESLARFLIEWAKKVQ